MLCPNCQHANREGVAFCESCGAKLEVPCPACGDMGPPERRFCGRCGASIGDRHEDRAGDATKAAMAASQERRHLTVMFCDLVGSTLLAERLDPEILTGVIRSYLDTARQVIARYEGYVARYMGDGILCYFGYPRAFEDAAERSVHAALDVIDAIGRLKPHPGLVLQTRAGIASGEVVTGETVRGDAGVETLAIGGTPNLAARLQSLADPDTVVVADSTRRLVRSNMDWVDLGVRSLKGFVEPQRAWKVAARLATPGQVGAGTAVMRPGELVGRDRELGLLLERYRAACDGRVQIVHVVGEPGIGKSTLVRALRETVASESGSEVLLQCSSLASNTPLFPVDQCIEHYARVAPGDDADTRLAKITSQLGDGGLDKTSVICLAQVMGVPVPEGSGDPALMPRQQYARALQALDRWIDKLTAGSTLLLIAEDVHWVDPTSLDWLRNLIETRDHGRLLVVVTGRPEFQPPWDLHANTEMINLSRMTPSGCGAIIDSITGGVKLPRELLDVLLSKTDGVPLFVEELTRTLIESGALEPRDGDVASAESLAGAGVPDSLRDSLMARLDRTPELREVVQIAAVIGREFDAGMLAAMAGKSQDSVEAGLARLEQNGVLRHRGSPPDIIWEFKHALVRDAAYDSILHSRRRELHGRVADTLMGQKSPLIGNRPEHLATHLSEARRPRAAIAEWRKAAQLARAAWANQEAVRHLQRALAVLDTLPDDSERRAMELELCLELGDAQRAARGSSAAETNASYRRARELCEGSGDLVSVLRAGYGEFVTSFVAARLDDALAPAEELLRIGKEHDDLACRVAGHQACGMHAFATGRLAEARSHFEQALTHGEFPPFEDVDIQYPGTCQSYLSWTLHILGESEEALRVSEESIRRAVDGSAYGLALTLGNACYLHQFRGDTKRVQELARELATIANDRDLPAWRDVAEFFTSWVACHLEPTNENAERLCDALGLWAEDEIETTYFKCIAGEACVHSGLVERGLHLIDEAEELAERTGERWHHHELQRIRTELQRERGVEPTPAQRPRPSGKERVTKGESQT